MTAHMTQDEIRAIVSDSLSLKRRFFEQEAPRILATGEMIAGRLLAGARVLAFGNGGSAADAQHFASELVGRLARDRRALAALALASDPSILTAVGNDTGFAMVFARQVQAYGRPGDVALAISTSGRSQNVVNAVCAAREQGLHTVALTGNGGGALKALVDDLVDVPHGDTQRIQEVHAMVLHLFAQIVEEAAARR